MIEVSYGEPAIKADTEICKLHKWIQFSDEDADSFRRICTEFFSIDRLDEALKELIARGIEFYNALSCVSFGPMEKHNEEDEI